MEISEWIALCSMVISVLITVVGSAFYVTFRIGGFNEKIGTFAQSLDSLRDDLKALKSETAEIRVEVGEIKVGVAQMHLKVDRLWQDHIKNDAS